MESIGAIMAEAEVVITDSTVMYDGDLITDMKCLTVEEIYELLDKEFEKWTVPENPIGLFHNRSLVLRYLSEIYRRNIPWPSELEWWEYDIVRCSQKTECGYDCYYSAKFSINYSFRYSYITKRSNSVVERRVGKILQPDEIRHHSGWCISCTPPSEAKLTKELSIRLHEQTVANQLWAIVYKIKPFVKRELEKLRKIKSIQLSGLKAPLVYDEINELMDSILDANGNKISEFKDYLLPEHYRLIRAGRDISEIKEQEELLHSLRIMKNKQKI
jgi:hypothetical protein